jgi:hypothetical protein
MYDGDLYQKKLEVFLHIILLENRLPLSYKSLLKINEGACYPVMEYLFNLINFYSMIKENVNDKILSQSLDELFKIKQFFQFCFVENKCPKLMWIWTLKLFQDLFEGNIILTLFYL